VTDAGLVHLKGLTGLEDLDLYFNKGITDAGLADIGGLVHLRSLRLIMTGVTEAGAKSLQAKLPRCNIDWIVPKATK
jgi:hypothetical protein